MCIYLDVIQLLQLLSIYLASYIHELTLCLLPHLWLHIRSILKQAKQRGRPNGRKWRSTDFPYSLGNVESIVCFDAVIQCNWTCLCKNNSRSLSATYIVVIYTVVIYKLHMLGYLMMSENVWINHEDPTASPLAECLARGITQKQPDFRLAR